MRSTADVHPLLTADTQHFAVSERCDALSELWSAASDRSLPVAERLTNLYALKAERERLGLGPTSVSDIKDGPTTPVIDWVDTEIAKLEP